MRLAAAMPDRNSFLRLLIARLPVDNLLPIYKRTRKPTLEAEAGNPGICRSTHFVNSVGYLNQRKVFPA